MTTPRDQAYRDILERGLVAIRNAAQGGLTALCAIEADHIHNIPSLLDETNESRHHYYITAERTGYLEQLKRLDAHQYLEQQLIWYWEPWSVLARHAGIELPR